MRRANCGSLEEENNQRHARCVIPGVIYRESAQRAAAREDGVTRQNENNQRRSRRNAPGAVEREQLNAQWQERNQVFENTSQHNERRQERMA